MKLTNMKIDVVIPVADGVEEMEVVILQDVLRRGGLTVVTASMLPRKAVHGAHRIRFTADFLWGALDLRLVNMLLIPGGNAGVESLRRKHRLRMALQNFASVKKKIGAICAGPLVLQEAGILKGRKITCYPTEKSNFFDSTVLDERVVVDRNLFTCKAAGASFEFALTILEAFVGEEKATEVKKSLYL